MNKITLLEVEYLRASRTIETIEVSLDSKAKIYFIYNYEGTHFRLFNSLASLIQFFESNMESKISFDKESELDAYLETVVL